MDTDEKWAVQTIQRQELVSAYENAALEAIAEYQQAKIRFAQAKAAAISKAIANHSNVRRQDAEFTAGQDPHVKAAVSDAAFYNQEAQMYMQAVLMLRSPSGYTPST